MSKAPSKTLLLLLWLTVSVAAGAQDNAQSEMRSLDEQVQEVKTDVLLIARDLTLLEERLLYPSNTHFAVFVAMESEPFRLDAVKIEIDGELVAHHIYTFKELEALQSGGVQRVYTGNVTTGTHELSVSLNGKLRDGSDFTENETFSFRKEIDPKLVGLTLAGRSGGANVTIGNW